MRLDRSRCPSPAAFTLVLCLLTLIPPVAKAEPTPPAAAARDQLYAEIAAEVAVLERQGNLLRKVVRLVKPTVVHIEAEKPPSRAKIAPNRNRVEESGAGVIIRQNNRWLVLTNHHVIQNSEPRQIRIQLSDGRAINPSQVWFDRSTDVAVMEIEADDLQPARLGDSDEVDMGDFVLAVGSPFGLSHSVTYGIISAKGRRDLKLGQGELRYQDFLQTDAAINPGNSGGPLLSLRGEVVGINTAIASNSGGSEGIGFTIPINKFMRIASQLVSHGRVQRAYLGVRLDRTYDANQARRQETPYRGGARVNAVTRGSPAATAGLQAGDVIVRLNGVVVEDDVHLVNLVARLPVGEQAVVGLYRDGRPLQFRVSLEDREAFETD